MIERVRERDISVSPKDDGAMEREDPKKEPSCRKDGDGKYISLPEQGAAPPAGRMRDQGLNKSEGKNAIYRKRERKA